MKRIFVVFLLFFTLPTYAIMVNDFTNMCGERAYDKIYATFVPLSYTCDAGEYLPADATECAQCLSVGFSCAGGTFDFNETTDQGLTPNTYTCASGYFLPANSETCAPCPNGWSCPGGTFDFSRTEYRGLIKNDTYMAGDENYVCASNYGHKIYAVFTPLEYACASGTFLPANSETCATCPDGYSCPGGTYSFHEKKSQGLIRDTEYYTTSNEANTCAWNAPHNLIAVFTLDHVCSAGYYLPADSDECTICPANNYCSGGTYLFDETTDQGIEVCSNNGFSPAGSSSANNCYPHIFHVGDDIMYMKSVKQTTPSLNIQIGNDIFYINMTTARTRMNKDSTHYFHVDWDDNHYYVCDDTMCPDAE